MATIVEPPPSPAPPASKRVTLAGLRRRHVTLLKRWTKLATVERQGAMADGFRRELAAAGIFFEDWADRDTIQGLVDYWTATMASLPGARGYPELIEVAEFDPATRRGVEELENPFLGLDPFGEGDRARFFGRADAAGALLRHVLSRPITVVSGPSGSGKSSLVFAGLLPLLREKDEFRILPPLTPGNDFLAALLGAVRPERAPPSWLDEARAKLVRSPERFAELVEVAAGEGRRAVLVVDQAEELLAGGEAEPRRAFLSAIAALAARPVRHRVVLTVRSDYLAALLSAAGLAGPEAPPGAEGSGANAVFTPEALTSRELHDAITGPAERIGVKIDPAVVEDLVREVVGEPAALPLLQFALSRLWDAAETDRIGQDEYDRVGPPATALRRAADRIYDDLRLQENQDAAGRIFLELTRPPKDGETLRQRASRERLHGLAASDRIDRVLDAFVAGGLIRRIPGDDADDDRFEIAHETLIRQWPRLAGWVEERRLKDQARTRLMAAAEQWRKSGFSRGYLLLGDALAEAQAHQGHAGSLDEFLAASRRWGRRLHWYRLGIALAVLVVLAAVSIFAWKKWDLADLWGVKSAQQEHRADQYSGAGVAAGARAQLAEQTIARLLADRRISAADLPPPLLARLRPPPPVAAGSMRALTGYDPDFLGVPLPPPRPGPGQVRLDYNNFSVIYDVRARLPVVAAGNLDMLAPRLPLVTASELPSDPRLPPAAQPEGLGGTDAAVGRVPALSWAEVGWQRRTLPPALTRNDFRPATVPQAWEYNQGVWSDVNQAVLLIDADRLSVAAGPVLGARGADGAAAPTAFWKVAAFRDAGGGLRTRAYLVPVGARRDAGRPGASRFVVPLAKLKAATGIDFAAIARVRPSAAQPPAAAQVTVYLQFAVMPREAARALTAALSVQGYVTPGEERVAAADGKSEVRFYHDEDAAEAALLAARAQAALSAQGFADPKVRAKRLRLAPTAPIPPPRVLELWVGLAPRATR